MFISRETSDWRISWRQNLRSMLRHALPHITEHTIEQLVTFAEKILEANELLHLVSQREPEREVVKQILDSATVLKHISFLTGCRLLDVGSGAGFPGIVLKLLFPGISLLSLDSAPRKVTFQSEVCSLLGVDAVFIESDLRRFAPENQVDVVIVKALSAYDAVVRRSRNWLHPLGWLIFMGGKQPNPSVAASVAKFSEFSEVIYLPYSLVEFDSTRHLVISYKK